MPKLPPSHVQRQSTLNESMTPNAAKGRTNVVAPEPRPLAPLGIASVSGDGVPTVFYLRLIASASAFPVIEQQAVLADYGFGLYGYASLAMGPIVPSVSKIVRLLILGDSHDVNVDYIELTICNADCSNYLTVYTDPFAVAAGATFTIGESGETQWNENANVGGVLSIGSSGGDQTLESTASEAYWVTANCGISA